MSLFFPSVATDYRKHFQCLNIYVLKIKTGPLSFETCSAFLSNLFNLKKINSPDALPTSYRRLYHRAQRIYLWPWLVIVPLYLASPLFLYCRIQQTVIRSCYTVCTLSPPPSTCLTLQQTGRGPWEGMCAPWSYHRSHRPCSNLTPRLETQRHSVQRFLHRQFAFPLQPYDGARVAYLKFVIYRNRPNVI